MGTIGRYGICEDVVVKLTVFECSYKYEYLVDNLTNESSSTVMYSGIIYCHFMRLSF